MQIMPLDEVYMESAEKVNVQKLTDTVESVQVDNRDDNLIIINHLLGESLDVLDDSRLRQLIEKDAVEIGAVSERKAPTADIRGDTTGQFMENVTFF